MMTGTEADQNLDRGLEPIATRLKAERPMARPAYRADLRRHLATRAAGGSLSRRGALTLASAYAGAGLVLLVLAALAVAGAGPLAT